MKGQKNKDRKINKERKQAKEKEGTDGIRKQKE